MAVDAGTIYSQIRIALDKLRNDLVQAEAGFDKFGKSNKKQSENFEKGWEKSYKKFSLAGTAAILAVTLAFKKAISVFAQTEQSLANVQAVTGASAQEFRELEAAAEEAGRTTRFTAGQSADALYFLGSAGFSATESIEALNGVLLLAGATGSDLASTAETVASNISAFNLEASEAERVSNVFAAAIGNSQATMEKLATSLRYVAPIASAFNQSIEGTTGLLQILFNNGFEASQAGTALRSSLADLANEISPANEKLKALGVSFAEINPQTNSYADIIEVLSEKVTDSSDVLAVFGDRAGPAMIKLIEAGREEIEKYTEAVTGTNAAAEQYAIQNDTLAGSIDKFKSALESFTNSVIKTLAPALRKIIDFGAKVLNFFTKLPKEIQGFIGGAGGAAAAIGLVAKALQFLGISAGAALGPIGLVVAAIAGAAIALDQFNRKTDQIAIDIQLKKANDRIIELNKQTEDTVQAIIEFSKETGISIERAADLADKQGLVTDEIRDQVDLLKEKAGEEENLSDNLEDELLKRNEIADRIKTGLEGIYDQTNAELALRAQVQDISEEFGVSLSKVIQIADTIDTQNEFLGTSIDKVKEELGYLKQSLRIWQDRAALEDLNKLARAQAAADREREKQALKDAEDAQKKYYEALKKEAKEREDARIKAFEDADKKEQIGIATTAEALKEKIKAQLAYIEAVLDAGIKDQEIFDLEVKKLNNLKALLEEIGEDRTDLTKLAEDLELTRINRLEDGLEKERELFQFNLEQRLNTLEEFGATEEQLAKERADAIAEYEIEKEKQTVEEKKAIRKQLADTIIDGTLNLIQGLNDLYQADAQNEIDAIQKKVDEGKITEEQGEKEIAQIRYKAALAEWNTKGVILAADVALGITKAIASAPFPLNLPAIGFATLNGGVQAAVLAKQRPKPPKLATGGVILPSNGGTQAILGENGSPEVALNLGQEGSAVLQELADRLNGGSGGRSQQIMVAIDKSVIYSIVNQGFDDVKLFITERNIRAL